MQQYEEQVPGSVSGRVSAGPGVSGRRILRRERTVSSDTLTRLMADDPTNSLIRSSTYGMFFLHAYSCLLSTSTPSLMDL